MCVSLRSLCLLFNFEQLTFLLTFYFGHETHASLNLNSHFAQYFAQFRSILTFISHNCFFQFAQFLVSLRFFHLTLNCSTHTLALVNSTSHFTHLNSSFAHPDSRFAHFSLVSLILHLTRLSLLNKELRLNSLNFNFTSLIPFN